MRYLIWSGEAYWRPGSRGYTTDLASAGVYEESEALAIVRGLGPEKGARLIPYRRTTMARARFAAWMRRSADLITSDIPASS